jgi:hypothetical protein
MPELRRAITRCTTLVLGSIVEISDRLVMLISALPSSPLYKPDLRQTSLGTMLLEIIMVRESSVRSTESL